MARAITWAIRIISADGREAFVREGGVIGKGPIATFYTKDKADAAAANLRNGFDAQTTLAVIERSHGRRF